MALTASRNVDRYVDQELRTLRVKGTTKLYRGAIVGLTSAGYARGLVAGSDVFCGISYEEMDNSAGADGAKVVRVYTLGDFEHAVSGAVQGDVGRPVFASADDTLTFVAAGNSYVGIVQDFVSSGVVIVRIDPQRRAVKTVIQLVEDLGAGADIAARAIHGFDADGWIVSARIVNQATTATGIDAGNACVVALAVTAGAVASKTYTNVVIFPAANTQDSLGTITNHHVPKGDVMTLAVTQGATANAGPFLVEVDYV
jgi:hypothetical protein